MASAPTPVPIPPTPAPAAMIALAPKLSRLIMSKHTFDGVDFRHRRFDDLNASRSIFNNCNFSYCIFDRGYFHDATFQNCDFTGARFYDCNLRGSSLHRCELRYSQFYRSLLEVSEIVASLPLEPNLRRDLLQNLRANAAEIGDYESQRLYVLQEIEANIEHWSRAMRGRGSYYIAKYGTGLERLKAGIRLASLRLRGFIWGHGERPFRILFSAILLVLALSLINFWAVLPRTGWNDSGRGLYIVKYSIDMLLDTPTDAKMRGFLAVDYALVAMRYCYIGLFISVLYKSISHR